MHLKTSNECTPLWSPTLDFEKYPWSDAFYFHFLILSKLTWMKWNPQHLQISKKIILIHNPTSTSCPRYILCIIVRRWKWQKHQEALVYPQGIPPLQLGPWPLGLSLTKRVIMSVWHTKQQIVWHSLNPILLFPVQICTEAVPSVRFSYSISCQGLESDQSGIVKRLRSTPRLLTIQWS